MVILTIEISARVAVNGDASGGEVDMNFLSAGVFQQLAACGYQAVLEILPGLDPLGIVHGDEIDDGRLIVHGFSLRAGEW